MPPRRDGIRDGQIIVVGGLLSSLSSAVPTPTRLALWDANRSAVPVHPCGLKMCDLASAKPESACDETDESRLKIVWRWKACTRFQQEFELAVGEDILMGVSGRERPPMTIRPFSRGLVVMRHP